MTPPVDLTRVERTLERALGGWAAGSILAGGLCAAVGTVRSHASAVHFGRQMAAWGAVDGIIAVAGAVSRRRREDHDDGAARRAARLRRVLLINAGADVAYIAGGAIFAVRSRHAAPTARAGFGDGVAIVVQGAFLLALDLSQARRLTPRADASTPGVTCEAAASFPP